MRMKLIAMAACTMFCLGTTAVNAQRGGMYFQGPRGRVEVNVGNPYYGGGYGGGECRPRYREHCNPGGYGYGRRYGYDRYYGYGYGHRREGYRRGCEPRYGYGGGYRGGYSGCH